MTLKEFFRKARRSAKWEVRNTISQNNVVRAVGRNECPLQAVAGRWLPSLAAEALGLPYAEAVKIANAADSQDNKDRPWLLKNLGVGEDRPAL